jgi:RNA polymerase sigma factor (sigma-70 family)
MSTLIDTMLRQVVLSMYMTVTNNCFRRTMPTGQYPLNAADINEAIETGGEPYWRKIYYAWFIPLKRFIAHEYAPIPDDVAEELSCRTLLKLINGRKKPQFSHINQFITWLYKAARSTSLDYWKSSQGRAFKAIDCVESCDDLFIELPSAVDDPVTDVRIGEVLQQLTEKERRLLQMRAEGTPYQVISRELAPVSAV